MLCPMAHTRCQVAKASDILLLLLNKTAESSTWSKVVVKTEEEISLILCTNAILAWSGISFLLTHRAALQLGSKWPLTQAGTRQSGIFTTERDLPPAQPTAVSTFFPEVHEILNLQMMRLPGSLTYQRTRRAGWGFQSQCSPLSITLFPWLHQALLAAVCLHSELVWGCLYSPHGHNSLTLIPALACSQQTHLSPVPHPCELAMAGVLLVLCKSPTDVHRGCPWVCNMKESEC